MRLPEREDGLPVDGLFLYAARQWYMGCPYRRIDKIPMHEHPFKEVGLSTHLRCSKCGLLKEKDKEDGSQSEAGIEEP